MFHCLQGFSAAKVTDFADFMGLSEYKNAWETLFFADLTVFVKSRKYVFGSNDCCYLLLLSMKKCAFSLKPNAHFA